MAETNETIADIIAEMRGGPIPHHRRDQELLRHYAERIEAAWNREKATIENSSAVGNAQKMREVVELLAQAILPPQEEYPAEYGGGKVPDEDGWLAWIRQMQVRACDALSAPPRNCDVGTVDEQINRHYRYCSCRLGDGDDPHGCERMSCSECVLRWAQMEYKEEAK